jgi:[protein-PII] uridylyltransferase
MIIVKNHRAIIDRKEIVLRLDEIARTKSGDKLRAALLEILKEAYSHGFDEIKARCMSGGPGHVPNGRLIVQAQCFLVDQILRILFDFTVTYVYPATNPTSSERLGLVAVGGYGRGELAPFSDLDLLFLLPYKQTAWSEQVVEYMLYILWDMGLKVGHSTRSVDECIRHAKADMTVRTALLESRYLWGDRPLFDELKARFETEIIKDSGPEFVESKLTERDERHKRMGDSRYVVEPNLKEGKGGLRDLHTLFWIAKYLYRVSSVTELVDKGVLTSDEMKRFLKAEDFLWTVRCHLHYIAGRPEERLTFDVQKELASRLNYTDREKVRGVERFMKHYYLVAKYVGDLTRIFCSHLEEQHKRKPRFRLPRLGLRRRGVDGFIVDGDRLTVEKEAQFLDNPVEMIRLFQVAQKHDYDIHPEALRMINQNLKRIDKTVRVDPLANQLFMEMLTSAKRPDETLKRMNEAGVLGRFIPDFGRVVAQMQHDMYHVYTVDEHTIRAIGILSRIEAGTLAEDHPLANDIIHKIVSKRVLYVAVMLHDIAKGRGGDHSILGEKVAQKLCPRLGMSAAETEMVAWLVRYHLLMSAFAFKRDVNDAKTVSDFVQLVASPERLRLLLVLTVADIRAVGPTIWNAWKGQLLRDLYFKAEEVLTGGHIETGGQRRLDDVHQTLRQGLSDWSDEEFAAYVARFFASYWFAVPLDQQVRNARLVVKADKEGEKLAISTRVNMAQGVTEVTLYTADHPGLFARISGALSLCGANIVDAKIFTTKDGMALDAFWIQDADKSAFSDPAKLERVKKAIRQSLAGEMHLKEQLSHKSALPKRTEVFTVEPLVLIDNRASNSHTVIEVNGRDRTGLLYDLSRALYGLNLSISSAHIATFGERAVDVFYVRDLFGHKVTHPKKLKAIEEQLTEALQTPEQQSKARALKAEKQKAEQNLDQNPDQNPNKNPNKNIAAAS